MWVYVWRTYNGRIKICKLRVATVKYKEYGGGGLILISTVKNPREK